MANQDRISSLLPVYNRADVIMARGEGVYLIDSNGKKYLDFAAGIAVNSLGHCHPHLVAALQEQAKELWYCSNLYRNPQLERLSDRLVEHSFADTVFMTNSGAEAVECGIKILRRFHYHNGQPRPRIITVTGGFHGRTFAGISASQNARATEGYAPLLEGFDQVAFGDLQALRKTITPQTGGILLETVQGEGGIRVQDLYYLQEVRKVANEHGLLLFIDEVQSGMGRTGKLFAFEHYGITPDICSVAKGIGSGFPLGACLATAHAARGMTKGSHGGTYGGNPLAMAVGNAVLDIILQDGFLENVHKMGSIFEDELAKITADFPHLIDEVRGIGLMLGVKMHSPTPSVVTRLRENGLLAVTLSNDNVIRFTPPLIITQKHVSEAISIIRNTLKDLK